MKVEPTILVAGGAEERRRWRVDALRRAGFTPLVASSADETLRLALNEPVDVVLLDALPDMPAPEVCRRLKGGEQGARLRVVHLLPGVNDEAGGGSQARMSADASLAEPVTGEVLAAVVRALAEQARPMVCGPEGTLELFSRAADHLVSAFEPDEVVDGLYAILAAPLGLDLYVHCTFDDAGSGAVASSAGLSPRELDAASSLAADGADAAHLCGGLARTLGIPETACVALPVEGEPAGAVIFGSRRRGGFSAEEAALVRALAGPLGSALERADFVERLRLNGERLEEELRTRAADAEETEVRLRRSERMAALGTLSAGLGHDMGNLLLPVRIRVDSMEKRAGAAEFREDIAAIRQAAEYLQQLASGIRLFTLDPGEGGGAAGRTELRQWWPSVEPFLRNALPRSVRLEHDIAPDLPPLRVSPQGLTQAVFNLVQNAGEALRAQPLGRVSLRARRAPDGRVALLVTDDGPGMTEEVRQRCMEPFYTTKTGRGSTGLGLALVHDVVSAAEGEVSIDSAPGRGTTFTLLIPAAPVVDDNAAPAERPVALVTAADARIRSYVRATLQAVGFDPRLEGDAEQVEALLWVADAEHRPAAKRFVSGSVLRRAVLLGGDAAEDGPGISSVQDPRSSAAVQERLREAVVAITAAEAAAEERESVG